MTLRRNNIKLFFHQKVRMLENINSLKHNYVISLYCNEFS